MDLNSIDLPETTDLAIIGPNGVAIDGAVITVRAPHHAAAVAYKKLLTAKLRKAASKARGSVYDAIDDNAEEDRLHAYTEKVSGLEVSGEPLDRDGMRAIYANPKYSWLTDQVAEKIRSWEDFLG